MYHGKLVSLRALEISDLDDLLCFYNTLELRSFLGPPIVRSRRYMEEWLVKASVSDPWNDGRLVLVIEEKETREFLGIARLEDIRLPHNRGEIGVSIYDPKNREKGLKAAAKKLHELGHVLGCCLIKKAVMRTVANSLYMRKLSGDSAARNLHNIEKAGFDTNELTGPCKEHILMILRIKTTSEGDEE